MEAAWLKEALFAGQTSNAFKLGTVLGLGWFWYRLSGCSVLYRGDSMETIDFTDILTVAEAGTEQIGPPDYVPHSGGSTYFYVVRRANLCGCQEHTLSAAVKVSIDAEGGLAQPQPNTIFEVSAEQAGGSKVQLTWFYCPLDQKSAAVCFKIYRDTGSGQIDYENPVATIGYAGRRFYSYRSDVLEAGTHLFVIRAEDAAGVQDSSLAKIRVHLDAGSPNAIEILSVETV